MIGINARVENEKCCRVMVYLCPSYASERFTANSFEHTADNQNNIKYYTNSVRILSRLKYDLLLFYKNPYKKNPPQINNIENIDVSSFFLFFSELNLFLRRAQVACK